MDKKICVFIKYHRFGDERVFHKELKSILGEIDAQVYYVAPKPDFAFNSGEFSNLHPVFIDSDISGLALYKLLLKLDCDTYHFHDPQFLFMGFLLKMAGKKVIYDVHEDYTEKIKIKFSGVFKSVLPAVWNFYEVTLASFYDAIITADSFIARKFSKDKTTILPNVPTIDFLNKKQDRKFDKFTVVYVGTIHEIRGLRKAVEAIQLVKYPDIELHIIGESRYPHLTELFNSSPRVTYRGRIPWENLSSELGLYHVGLALFQPVPAFTYYPGENVVKLFEYAGLGIPFIISNFEGLSKFVKTYGGGLTADPTNPAEIARTIEKLYEDQVLYNRLSQEGQELVRKEFHWEAQKQKLINVYKKLLRH